MMSFFVTSGIQQMAVLAMTVNVKRDVRKEENPW